MDGAASRDVNQYWANNRQGAMAILKRESELDELVRLVGMDALSAQDRLLMEAAKMIREDFLHQNAHDPVDTYTSLPKQFKLLQIIIAFYHWAYAAIAVGAELDDVIALPVRAEISRAKGVPEEELGRLDELRERVRAAIEALKLRGERL